jgi:hypothetical protein
MGTSTSATVAWLVRFLRRNTMDGAGIFVLVATMAFVGFIVWVNIYGPRESKAEKTTTSDGNPGPIPGNVGPSIERRRKKKKR